jgi:hypothetical protein
MENNTFKELSKIKCKIDKKGRFNYISWAEAWKQIKSVYPDATFKIYEKENVKDGVIYSTGVPVFKVTDNAGAFVKVGVTINEIEYIEHYPITDHFNKAITTDRIDVMHINTAIKRALVKALAFHGLGLYVFHGEDLPEE